ncbi:MAG: FAD-dependent oxidoreductase [Candidatus Omnitrophica bacterium]|nr:FAD-dependent oxidoreductase [Candidatus Omnitrophota bacterium]
MQKVLIIGGGFAGLSAAVKLGSFNKDLDITVVDGKDYFEFLPMLPDVIGGRVNPGYLRASIPQIGKRCGFKFSSGEIISLYQEENKALSSHGIFYYDYLIIASGSATNFYGDRVIERRAFKLDNVMDALEIREVISKEEFDTYVISGGGYTGVEIATNIRRFLKKNRRSGNIVIVEKTGSILGPLPQWMKHYAIRNLRNMNIEILMGRSIEKVESDTVFISGDRQCRNAMLIWSAGVKTSDYIQNLNVAKGRQGRIKVNQYLKFHNNAFAIGDAAEVYHRDTPLRMAVQFSIAEGNVVAENIIRSIKGKKLRPYRPIDLGYIIPMANNSSCGTVLGLDVTGPMATFFHYMMCLYRSYGIRNKFGILGDVSLSRNRF